MNTLQLEITKLIGKKELTFGCWLFIQNPDGYAQYIEETDAGNGFTIMSSTDGYSVLNDKRDEIKDWHIIGHPATLSDLHRWVVNMQANFTQYPTLFEIDIGEYGNCNPISIQYDISKDLLDQSSETLKQLIDLISSYQ